LISVPGVPQREIHRRIITFTTQISQKTMILKNWGLSKKGLIERKELTSIFMKNFEKKIN
jgi:hypothetical protein